MGNPSWDLYRSFLAVFQKGSLSGAARELGSTQPTLGRHIEELEALLGLALFTRSPQGFLPTENARRLIPHARAIEAAAAALLREVPSEEGRIKGSVRITAADIVSTEILPAILAPLLGKYPELTIELDSSNSSRDLLAREADIAVRMFRPTQKALVSKKVGEIELGWHAHKGYLQARGTPAKLEDLAAHTLIGYRTETEYMRKMKPLLKLPAGMDWDFKTDSDLTMLAALRGGVGVGICHVQIGRRDPNLVRLLPKALQLQLPTWIVMHENLKTDPRHRIVFDALAEGLKAYANGS